MKKGGFTLFLKKKFLEWWSCFGPASVLLRSCFGPASVLLRSCFGPAVSCLFPVQARLVHLYKCRPSLENNRTDLYTILPNLMALDQESFFGLSNALRKNLSCSEELQGVFKEKNSVSGRHMHMHNA